MAKEMHYLHDNGRRCEYRDGQWVMETCAADDDPACRMEHWMHKVIHLNDRGEFGFPGVGSTSASSILDVPTPPLQWSSDEKTKIVIDVEPATDEAQRILEQIPSWLGRFLQKNRKYARAQHHDLGDKGIMPDINRKVSVLMDRIWYEAEEVDEGTVEVIDDLLGHLMLLRDKLVSRESET